MNTIRLWVATAWHFDLIMAGFGLRLLGVGCLKLAESARDYCNGRQGAGDLQTTASGAVWPKVVGSWGWFWAKRAMALGAGSKRRLKRAQELAEKERLFSDERSKK